MLDSETDLSVPLTVIYHFAGRDASAEYNRVHAPSLIKSEDGSSMLKVGELEISPTSLKRDTASSVSRKPGLDEVINLNDFETIARSSLPQKPWAFVSSGANDNITRDANVKFLQRIWFRPAIMR